MFKKLNTSRSFFKSQLSSLKNHSIYTATQSVESNVEGFFGIKSRFSEYIFVDT